jgi:hypothetical protein
LPAEQCYRRRCDVQHHIRGHYPSFIAHTGSCARPNPSRQLWIDLLRRVFAGCHQSLLGDGPSRRYLCNPYAGAWTPTPWCPAGAHTRYFPAGDGLTSGLRRSAHQSPLQCNFNRAYLSRLQSVRDVQAPAFARPPECTHRRATEPQGGRTVYTTQNSVGYLPRAVVSLHVRDEQLTRLDFHQLDCSLVGCS